MPIVLTELSTICSFSSLVMCDKNSLYNVFFNSCVLYFTSVHLMVSSSWLFQGKAISMDVFNVSSNIILNSFSEFSLMATRLVRTLLLSVYA